MNTAVVFDIWGPFAVYRKFFTNTSILSYPFPPPTAIRGLVGAFLGMSRAEYAEKIKDMTVAISMINPVKKMHTTINYLLTKEGENSLGKGRTQIPTEIIKDPCYRIYVRDIPAEYKEQLVQLLSNHCTQYIPYLGTSEMIANFQFVGEYAVEDCNNTEPVFVNSIVPARLIEASLVYQYNNRLGKERVPFYMDANKQTMAYMDVAFDMDAKPVPIGSTIYSVINSTNVRFLTQQDTISVDPR